MKYIMWFCFLYVLYTILQQVIFNFSWVKTNNNINNKRQIVRAGSAFLIVEGNDHCFL